MDQCSSSLSPSIPSHSIDSNVCSNVCWYDCSHTVLLFLRPIVCNACWPHCWKVIAKGFPLFLLLLPWSKSWKHSSFHLHRGDPSIVADSDFAVVFCFVLVFRWAPGCGTNDEYETAPVTEPRFVGVAGAGAVDSGDWWWCGCGRCWLIVLLKLYPTLYLWFFGLPPGVRHHSTLLSWYTPTTLCANILTDRLLSLCGKNML